MTARFLFAAALAAVSAPLALAAAPQLAFRAPGYEVTTSPGATIAYLYVVEPSRYGAGSVTDTDGDGKVLIDLGVTAQAPGAITVADVGTGEFASTKGFLGIPAHWLLRGPTGELTELALERPVIGGLWVRPGVGAWAPSGAVVADRDGSSTNQVTIGSVRGFEALGSSPAAPAGFARGDRFFGMYPNSASLPGGVVDASVDRENTTGGVSLLEPIFAPPAAFAEGEDIVLPVFRLFGTHGTASVRLTRISGTAVPEVDFAPFDSMVTFAPGEVLQQVRIRTIDDEVWSGTRGITVQLSEPAGTATFNPLHRTVVIADDDPAPVVAIEAPATITETDAPQTISAALIVTGARRVPVTVRYSPGGLPATDVVFQPGETRKDFSFTIPGDDVTRPSYTYGLWAELRDTSQRATHDIEVIDDELPTLSVAGDGAQEGTSLALVASYAPFRPANASFQWRTVDGTAKAGEDYVAASGTWDGRPWELRMLSDAMVEGPETFYVELTDVASATPAATRLTITIYDDDGLPPPNFANMSVAEGDGLDFSRTAAMLVLPAPLAFPVTYGVTVEPGTATRQADFIAAQSSVTFQAGQNTARFEMLVFRDDLPEEDETLTLRITKTNAVGVYTIVDDDRGPGPSVRIDDLSFVESLGANRNAAVRVRLSEPFQHETAIGFTVTPGTATHGADYLPVTQSITMPPGATIAQILIGIVNDGMTEPDEHFFITLTAPAGGSLARARATVTIVDDDPAPPDRKRAVRH